MKIVHMIAFALLVVGGLNWGFTAFGYNLVDMILGADSVASKVVYVLVALSAVYKIATHKGTCNACSSGSVATTV